MNPIHTRNLTIGLLGGSFNPAHAGHLHISLHALRSLPIDEIWWLVSPQNPLKSKTGMASYTKRLESACTIASTHPKIRVLDIERRFQTHYTYKTIAMLKQRFAGTHFVWLMGADNLSQFHRWRHWQRILEEVPVIVFDRAPYSHTALRSKAFIKNKKFLKKYSMISDFNHPPAIYYMHMRRVPISSTLLRKMLGEGAFLGHNENTGCD